jgi:D-alanyl-lipoteichoic acid acyltransferase DltB (MBOAT superfamily)
LPTINSRIARLLLDYFSIFLTVHFVWLGFLLVKQPNIESMISTIKALFLGVF